MKILILSHEYPPIGGGGANACTNLAREYALVGHEVHVVTVGYQDFQIIEEIPFWQGTNLEEKRYGKLIIHRVKSKRQYIDHCSFSEMLDYLVKAFPVINKLQREIGFDICQVFFGIPSGPLGLFMKIRYHIPYVIRFGGGDIPGAQKRYAAVYKVLTPFIKAIWSNASALVANSIGLKKRAMNFDDKHTITVIPNGVRRFEADGEIRKKNTDVFNILFVSRLIEGKGIQDILPYFESLIKECSELGKTLTFKIVGDGPYRNTLEELVEEYNLRNNIEFCGYKSKTDLSQYYNEADLFVFPSRSEGMPNAVLEAMAYGLPIIMTPCEGSDELIDGNGYVIAADRFEEKILEMIKNDKLRIKLGEKSRYLTENLFTWEKSAKKYLDLFVES